MDKIKKGISAKLSMEDIELLNKLGGKTKGIELVIREYRERANGIEDGEEKGIEGKFWDGLITPENMHLMETYRALVETYILNGHSLGTIDYYIPRLTGKTGFDEKTITKHIRKLGNAGYIVFNRLSFRPTLRLIERMGENEFSDIFMEFEHFLRKEKSYVDFLESKGPERQYL